jgi:hypothetical protein
MKKVDFYLHNDNSISGIKEWMTDERGLTDLPENILNALVADLYRKFYEVKFDVEYDETTGKIGNITAHFRK